MHDRLDTTLLQAILRTYSTTYRYVRGLSVPGVCFANLYAINSRFLCSNVEYDAGSDGIGGNVEVWAGPQEVGREIDGEEMSAACIGLGQCRMRQGLWKGHYGHDVWCKRGILRATATSLTLEESAVRVMGRRRTDGECEMHSQRMFRSAMVLQHMLAK
ncbi:hypothetical protein M422DRAFT_38751 [Sphaerobolus stellatus SS14]|uniref:Unplaced genomic scaffold SPHSTscaffold_342, whole genome shotgun sequence n=1 Tax=Sphaerobolus stellatus (strain SS14) TaxID=990650 RepID=A0A0C9U8Q2_SPHS4|nr:hypothetical protein M422DRAFT_38751 [Sphaerobolus stellatus SS14]